MKPWGLLGSETGFGEGVGGSLSPRRAAASALVFAKPLTHPHGSKPSLDLWPRAGKETWVCTRDLPGNQMQHLRGTLREGSAGRAQPPAQDTTSFPLSSPEQLQGRPGPTAACPGSVPAGTSLVQLNTQHRTRGWQLCSRHPSPICRLRDLGQHSPSPQLLLCSSLAYSKPPVLRGPSPPALPCSGTIRTTVIMTFRACPTAQRVKNLHAMQEN